METPRFAPIATHHWGPYEAVRQIVAERVGGMQRILEIGPGSNPFPPATEYVDWQKWPQLAGKPLHVLDLNQDRLPFEDKSFDFVYCRHTVEDVYNAPHLLSEMSRVSRAGYVETPSPVAECTRGVDASSPPWRGYVHHRYVLWSDGEVLRLVQKAPVIEHVDFGEEEEMATLLNLGPLYWNTYFLWEGELKFHLYRHDVDFLIQHDYRSLLVRAMQQSVDASVALAKQHGLPY